MMPNPPQRSQRFYGRRKGRPLSTIRKQLLEDLLPKLCISIPENGDINLNALFGNKNVWLEIGFGGGEHLATLAQRHPSIGFVGCEAYLNGVTSLLTHVHNNSLDNVRIYPDDVRPFLKRIAPKSIERIFVLFPDPWPKKRHHKRRIICDEQIQEFTRILKAGGQIVIASDDPDYVQSILEIMEGVNKLQLVSHVHTPPTDWVTTRYEKRARRLGNTCSYLMYTLNSHSFYN
ncbi:MAG: tRNA (guanosine(46)-N7)-methyltransferase TrmB [Pseudomonadota bacterium]